MKEINIGSTVHLKSSATVMFIGRPFIIDQIVDASHVHVTLINEPSTHGVVRNDEVIIVKPAERFQFV